jgi:hypothetical protein
MLAESGCDNCRLTHHNELYVADLSLHGGKFVQILKGEFSCDDEEYQSSLKWFLCSIERFIKYLEEGPASAPKDSRGNREDRSRVWNEFLGNMNGDKGSLTPFSSVKELPKPIRSLIKDGYKVAVKDIGEPAFGFITTYLGFTGKVFGELENDPSRTHFVAPILFRVGGLFDDLTIDIEEDLKGTTVNAHGRFDFLCRRRGKAVGIVLAKTDRFDEGIAQALLGCQVLAGHGRDTVHAIVTDFERWTLIRDTEEAIWQETIHMPFLDEGFNEDLLRQVVGKIYSVLSDD